MSRVAKKVFVALSGGVDSSVTAALLKERGFDVTGVHIKMWSDPEIPCTFKEDRYDAMRVAAHLGIPFETWDFTKEYRAAVVDYMIREYAAGRTPNPDVMCNRHVKFGIFLKQALERGADYVATGHYVRKSEIRNPKSETNSKLLAAEDKNKDQSYFLWTLTQEQLRCCLFPIGDYIKSDVREMARKFGLPTAEKKDSQGICFMGEIDLTEFLKKHIPMERGPVMTTAGCIVGKHNGLAFYTIGQREGLGMGGGGIPYYVAEKDFITNTLVVAAGPYDKKLFTKEVMLVDSNWISGVLPKFPLRCEARIRYRQPLENCSVSQFNEFNRSKIHQSINQLKVVFNEPQRAVTPGQSIVFYQNNEMLGGGCIL